MFWGTFLVLGVFLWISFLIPFKKKTLITGEFSFEMKEINFLDWDGGLWRGFYFEQYCLECYRSGRRIFGFNCYDGVPLAARERSSYAPQRGDYVRLDVWETLWGKRKAYAVSLVTDLETIRLIKEGRDRMIHELIHRK